VNLVTLCDDREVFYAAANGQIRTASNNPKARVSVLSNGGQHGGLELGICQV
jgi:hypothetical protein